MRSLSWRVLAGFKGKSRATGGPPGLAVSRDGGLNRDRNKVAWRRAHPPPPSNLHCAPLVRQHHARSDWERPESFHNPRLQCELWTSAERAELSAAKRRLGQTLHSSPFLPASTASARASAA